MKSIFLVLGILLSCQASAATWTYGLITRVHFWEGISGVLIQQQGQANPENCPRPDQYILLQSHQFYKEMYSMILAANFADRPIGLFTQGCDGNGFPIVHHIVSNY